MDTNFENPSINMNAKASGITKKDIEEVFSSANSALEEINASLNKIADILAKGLETKKEIVEEKEIASEEPIVNEEITNELPTLEVSNTTMPELEESNNIEVPTEEPVINNDEVQIQNTEPVIEEEPKIEETNTNDSVISIGDLLAQESAKEELPAIEVPTPALETKTPEVQVQNTEPVVETPAVTVQEQVTSPVVETTENVTIPEVNVPQSNVQTMPEVNNSALNSPSIDTQVPTNEAVAPVVEPQNNENNVVVLDTVVTDAIGDGKQRSIITNENEHKNLLGKEKALTMSMSMGQAA